MNKKNFKFSPGNIWSGAGKGLSVLTNPTELAHRKGTLKKHYPVRFKGLIYPDAEAAYQAHKMSLPRFPLMVEILVCKLHQHPLVYETLKNSGGVRFLSQCSHTVYGRSWWEGIGEESPFIRALQSAYSQIEKEL